MIPSPQVKRRHKAGQQWAPGRTTAPPQAPTAYAVAAGPHGGPCVRHRVQLRRAHQRRLRHGRLPCRGGPRLWLKRYGGHGSGFDGARSVAVSPGGRVLVTGSGASLGGSQDFAVIAYRG